MVIGLFRATQSGTVVVYPWFTNTVDSIWHETVLFVEFSDTNTNGPWIKQHIYYRIIFRHLYLEITYIALLHRFLSHVNFLVISISKPWMQV